MQDKFIQKRLGKRYGRLVVVGYAGQSKGGIPLWDCKCDCGNSKTVASDGLGGSGGAYSCGCLRTESNRSRCVSMTEVAAIRRSQPKADECPKCRNKLQGRTLDPEGYCSDACRELHEIQKIGWAAPGVG